MPRLQATLQGNSSTSGGDDKLRARAVEQLSSLFIFQLLREMRKTVPESGLWDGGRAQEIYEEMLDERLADAIASSRQLGLTSAIQDELTKYT